MTQPQPTSMWDAANLMDDDSLEDLQSKFEQIQEHPQPILKRKKRHVAAIRRQQRQKIAPPIRRGNERELLEDSADIDSAKPGQNYNTASSSSQSRIDCWMPKLTNFNPHEKTATIVWKDIKKKYSGYYCIMWWVDGDEVEQSKSIEPEYSFEITPGFCYNVQVAAVTTVDDSVHPEKFSEILTFSSGITNVRSSKSSLVDSIRRFSDSHLRSNIPSSSINPNIVAHNRWLPRASLRAHRAKLESRLSSRSSLFAPHHIVLGDTDSERDSGTDTDVDTGTDSDDEFRTSVFPFQHHKDSRVSSGTDARRLTSNTEDQGDDHIAGMSTLSSDFDSIIKHVDEGKYPQLKGYIKICEVFTPCKSATASTMKVACTVPTFCTSDMRTATARLIRVVQGKWEDGGCVYISGQQFVHCELDAGECYALVLPVGSDMRNITFYTSCRIYPTDQQRIICEVAMDNGILCMGREPLSYQRFAVKMGETVNIMLKKSDTTICDWNYSLDSQSVNASTTTKKTEKLSIQQADDDTIMCTVSKNMLAISQTRFRGWSKEYLEKKEKPSNQPIVENLPETSLHIQLPMSNEHAGNLKFVAKSLSSGHEISSETTASYVILNGINPGDKYSICVYELSHDQHSWKLIAKSEIQTSKEIGEDGGKVEVGNCSLIFPQNAVKNGTSVEISDCKEGVPYIPNEYFCITPILDFRSSQKKFSEHVQCKLTTPHITVEKPVPVEVMCYEDNKWQKVCSSYLTENGTIEFKCDHFTPYAVIILIPYDLLPRQMSFRMANMVYFDKNDNFVCVTCLDYEYVKSKCKSQLSEANYIRSAFIIPNFKLKLEETVRFTLTCPDPDRTIGEWQTTLNRDFVEEWQHMKDLRMDRIEGKDRIILLFKRMLGDTAEEKRANVSYPLDKNAATATMSAPSNMAVNTIQGQHIHVENRDTVLHGVRN